MRRFTSPLCGLIVAAALALPLLASAAPDAPAAPADGAAAAEGAAPAAPAPPATPEQIAEGKAAFGTVYQVLMSPRCMNCHPTGDRPLQTDASVPHVMNISRTSEKNGLACATCHQETNSDTLGSIGGPPGAPHWHLPPEDVPMVFEGHTPASLCAQLKDPSKTGDRDLDKLVHHVANDALVLWGWKPGAGRTVPPVPHDEFVAAMTAWAKAGGPCPDE